MAKRRKYKKSSKCPEPFNTLLDIAGGIAMNAIANKMEKKHHYSQKGKINPYKVSAFKIGTGGFNSTEDIIKTGAFLGAIGSFDAETDTSYPKQKMINVTPEDPIFNQIKYSSTINNKYAWRLNCQDGSEYGVDPCDYETREEYNEALEESKEYSISDDCVADDNPSDKALKELKQSHVFKTEKRRALTIAEQELFLNYLRNNETYSHWYPIFAVMLGTGMRVGEITGLMWCDIDIDISAFNFIRTSQIYSYWLCAKRCHFE